MDNSNFLTGQSLILKDLYFSGAAVLQDLCNTYMYLFLSSVRVKEVSQAAEATLLAAGCKPPHKHLPFVISPLKCLLYNKNM